MWTFIILHISACLKRHHEPLCAIKLSIPEPYLRCAFIPIVWHRGVEVLEVANCFHWSRTAAPNQICFVSVLGVHNWVQRVTSNLMHTHRSRMGAHTHRTVPQCAVLHAELRTYKHKLGEYLTKTTTMGAVFEDSQSHASWADWILFSESRLNGFQLKVLFFKRYTLIWCGNWNWHKKVQVQCSSYFYSEHQQINWSKSLIEFIFVCFRHRRGEHQKEPRLAGRTTTTTITISSSRDTPKRRIHRPTGVRETCCCTEAKMALASRCVISSFTLPTHTRYLNLIRVGETLDSNCGGLCFCFCQVLAGEQRLGIRQAHGRSDDPMDTIFVKNVREQSTAHQAGLRTGIYIYINSTILSHLTAKMRASRCRALIRNGKTPATQVALFCAVLLPTCTGDNTNHCWHFSGDRIVCVNGKVGLNYAQVVQLIQHSETYLHLLVVPKEDDLLQQVSSMLSFQLKTKCTLRCC